MRLLFICTLLCTLAIPALAQTTRSSSAQLVDWEKRLLSKDPKVRAIAQAALVQEAERSLPLLRRFLNRRIEDLHLETFEIIRRIGPPAIPLIVELLRDHGPPSGEKLLMC